MSNATAGLALDLSLTLERLGVAVAIDRVIDFPADPKSVPLSLTVDLSANSPVEGERMAIRLRFITEAGDTVFRGEPDTLPVEPTGAGAPPSAVVVRPIHVGPGARAVQVVARDAFCNTATGFTRTVTIAFGANPGGATSMPFHTSTTLIAWTYPRGGSWSTPSNRSLGHVPNAIDGVLIDLAGSYTVNLDRTFRGTFITAGGRGGAQTLAFTGAMLAGSGSLVNPASASLSNSSVVVTSVVNAGTLIGNGFGTDTVATGTLNLGGLAVGSQYDQISVNDAVTLDDSLAAPLGPDSLHGASSVIFSVP